MSSSYWTSTQKNKWQLSKEALSRARAAVVETERRMRLNIRVSATDLGMRLYLHGLVNAFGKQLNIRQRAIATAETYLMRFFIATSLHEVNVYVLVATCVYLACKIEECPLHLRTITTEARVLWPDYITTDPTKIAECEFYLIEELDSYLIVYHPYRSLQSIATAMALEYPQQLELSPADMQSIFAMINDSYATDMMLLYPPHLITMACIYMMTVLRSPVSSGGGSTSTAAATATSSGGNPTSSSSSGTGGPGSVQMPNLLPSTTRTPQEIKDRIELLVQFIGRSGIDLDKLAQCIQEMICLYVRWETYDENLYRNYLAKILLG